MKKFLIKGTFLFLAIYIPWFYITRFGLNIFGPIDYLSWSEKAKLVKQPLKTFNPQNVAFGDSLLVAALNPAETKADLFNFGMSGATPAEVYFLVRRYLASGRRPEKVFLSFGITHLQGSDVFRQHALGFHFYHYPEFQELLKVSDTYGYFYNYDDNFKLFKNWIPFKYFYPKIPAHFIATLDYFMFETGISSEQILAFKNRILRWDFNLDEKKAIISSINKNKGHHLFEQGNQNHLKNPLVIYDSFSIHPVNDHFLRKTINLLNQYKIQTYLEFVPNNFASWKYLTPSYFDQRKAYLEKLKEDFPNISYNELKSYPSALFGDPDHVNQNGQMKYTQEFENRHFRSFPK